MKAGCKMPQIATLLRDHVVRDTQAESWNKFELAALHAHSDAPEAAGVPKPKEEKLTTSKLRHDLLETESHMQEILEFWFPKGGGGQSPAILLWVLRSLCMKLRTDIELRDKNLQSILKDGSNYDAAPGCTIVKDGKKRAKQSTKELVDSAFELTKREFEQVLIGSGAIWFTR